MKRQRLFRAALDAADALIANLDDLADRDEDDARLRQEVDQLDRERERELLAAAERIGRRNRGEE